MKKVIILLAIFALLGCEKEICWECIAKCTIMGQTSTVTQIYCGNFSRSEAKDMIMSMTTSAEGLYCEVDCKEVD